MHYVVSRLCLTLGKVKDFFQSGRPGYVAQDGMKFRVVGQAYRGLPEAEHYLPWGH